MALTASYQNQTIKSGQCCSFQRSPGGRRGRPQRMATGDSRRRCSPSELAAPPRGGQLGRSCRCLWVGAPALGSSMCAPQLRGASPCDPLTQEAPDYPCTECLWPSPGPSSWGELDRSDVGTARAFPETTSRRTASPRETVTGAGRALPGGELCPVRGEHLSGSPAYPSGHGPITAQGWVGKCRSE